MFRSRGPTQGQRPLPHRGHCAPSETTHERYNSQCRVLRYYRDNIIPDQVQAYRTLATRHQQSYDCPGCSDLVLAQQSLATSVTTHLHALEEAWFAVVDIGKLLQARDLF